MKRTSTVQVVGNIYLATNVPLVRCTGKPHMKGKFCWYEYEGCTLVKLRHCTSLRIDRNYKLFNQALINLLVHLCSVLRESWNIRPQSFWVTEYRANKCTGLELEIKHDIQSISWMEQPAAPQFGCSKASCDKYCPYLSDPREPS